MRAPLVAARKNSHCARVIREERWATLPSGIGKRVEYLRSYNLPVVCGVGPRAASLPALSISAAGGNRRKRNWAHDSHAFVSEARRRAALFGELRTKIASEAVGARGQYFSREIA